MNFLEAVPNSTPIIISITSVLATVLIVVLVQVAGRMYRNADKMLTVMAWKMALYDKDEYKVRLKIENTTGKVTHMRNISLVYIENKKMYVYSKLSEMPIQADDNFDFISGDKERGYALRIFPYGKHNVVLDFRKDPNIVVPENAQMYFCYTNNRGKHRVARIDLGTDRVQMLQFKNQK